MTADSPTDRAKLWSVVATSFVVSRTLIYSIALLSNRIIKAGGFEPVHSNSLSSIFYRWDALWYVSIVEKGYHYVPGHVSNVAFFPLYPMAVKLLAVSGGDPRWLGLIVSNVALIGAGYWLYRIVNKLFDGEIASLSVWLLMLTPTAFFYSAVYSEALFLMTALACVYFSFERRWLVASIWGMLAALTRSVGIFLLIPMTAEYFKLSYEAKSFKLSWPKWDIVSFALLPAALASFAVYLHFKVGDYLAFIKVQSAWDRKASGLITTLSAIRNYGLFNRVVFGGTIVIAVVLLYLMWRQRLRLSLWLLAVVLTLFYLWLNLLISTPRLFGVIFPFYISLAILARKYRWVEVPLIVASTSFLIFFTILFVNGYKFF